MTSGKEIGRINRAARGRRLARKMLEHWQLYLMALPALAYILLFVYKPMYGIIIAFKNYKFKLGILGSKWVGLSNFRRLLESYWFPIILRNTLTLSGLSLLIGFPVPIILALMVNEVQREAPKRLFQTVSYAPHFISTVVVCGMIQIFLSPSSGIINNLIERLGGQAVYFMQDARLFKWIYVISGIWQEAGWGAIIYFAALSGVDKALIEASQIDGASRMQRIRYVNLPMLTPTILVMLILRCGSLLSVGYEKVYLLQNSTNLTGSEIISTYVYKIGLESSDFSFSTATNLLNSLVNCVILISVNFLASRLTETSLW